MHKAKIVKFPAKYAVIVNNKIVDWAATAYQAAEKAKYHNANEMEVVGWEKCISVLRR